jgi:glycosyltransferase involved in cell wall biosynthesis
MKVALAHDHLFQFGGAESVLSELSKMYPQAPIHTLICNKQNFSSFKDAIIKTSFLQKLPGGVSHFKWYLKLMPMAWEQFDFSKYDVVISSSSAFVKGIITPINSMHYCYCHTPTRYLWSDRREYIENLSIPHILKLYLMSTLSKLRSWDQAAAARVNHFIANSQFVAERIKKYYHRDSTVIYPPVRTATFYVSQEIGKYFLIVSRLRPYKRVDLAVEAFNNLRLPLIIIGGGEELPRLKKMAKKNIKFLGEVSTSTRNRYLAKCRAFIHPQVEDFGISVVEAMASGRPVIAFQAGGALETIIPGESGIFFKSQDWESLVYAVLHFNQSDFDPKKIQEAAAKYDQSIFETNIKELINQGKDK